MFHTEAGDAALLEFWGHFSLVLNRKWLSSPKYQEPTTPLPPLIPWLYEYPYEKKSPLRTGFQLQIQLCCGVYIMLYITLPFSVSVSVCVTILTLVIGEGLRLTCEFGLWPPVPADPLLWSLHSSVVRQTRLKPVISWYNENKLDEVHIWQFFFSHGFCIFVFQTM